MCRGLPAWIYCGGRRRAHPAVSSYGAVVSEVIGFPERWRRITTPTEQIELRSLLAVSKSMAAKSCMWGLPIYIGTAGSLRSRLLLYHVLELSFSPRSMDRGRGRFVIVDSCFGQWKCYFGASVGPAFSRGRTYGMGYFLSKSIPSCIHFLRAHRKAMPAASVQRPPAV